MDARTPTTKKSGRFGPAAFLETIATGRSIATHQTTQIIFKQGDAADAVFYIKKARSKSRFCPSKARKPLSPSWEPTSFSVRDA